MAFDYLFCTACRCPLPNPASSATGVSCPRCNAWIELDPLCGGGCISCYKTRGAQKNITSCTAEPGSDSVPVTITGTAGANSRNSAVAAKDDARSAGNSWKALVQRIFAVR